MKFPDKDPGSGPLWLLIITYSAVGFSIYFALGVVAEHGLGLTPLIFLASGLLFVLTMFTYLEGGAMLRERGGSSSFARHAFNELIAFVSGWVILLDYLIVIALAVLSVPHYLKPITGDLDGTVWIAAIIAAVVLYITVMNTLDVPARRRPRFLVILAGADFALQVLVVLVGLFVVMEPDNLTRNLNLFTDPSIGDAVYAAVLAMLAYAGIEAVSNLSPDLDLNPGQYSKIVARAIWTVPLLYAGMAAIALMAVPVTIGPSGAETELGTTFLEAPVLGVVSSFEPPWLSDVMQWLVALVAAGTLIWAANTAMLGVSRHTYTLAVNRQIPSWLGQLGRRYETPYKIIIICALIVFGLALTGDVEVLAGVYAFGATLAITIAHLSILRLRRTAPKAKRPFMAPLNHLVGGTPVPLTAVVGVILSSLAFISVLVLHDAARWVGLAWLAFGLVFYLIYRVGIEKISLTRRVTVDPRALTRPKIEIALHNIVVPIFGTELDDDIISTAGLLAAEGDPDDGGTGARLTIVYPIKVPMSLAIDAPLSAGVEAEMNRVTKRAKEVAEEYADVDVSVEVIRTRRNGEGIVEAADRLDADAIVIGSEPPTPIKGGPRLGGVADVLPEEIGPATAHVLKRAGRRVLLTAPPSEPLSDTETASLTLPPGPPQGTGAATSTPNAGE